MGPILDERYTIKDKTKFLTKPKTIPFERQNTIEHMFVG